VKGVRYREFDAYAFGLKAGALSLFRNGFRAGFRATASAILQPVNSFTRFPEYFFLEEAVAALARARGGRAPLDVLDIGSPKLAGMILADRHLVRLRATDLSPLALDPYATIWRANRRRAVGEMTFERADARKLPYPGASFDVVYALSVLEHIEGERGDAAAAAEMARVLRPGGTLVVSVPLGPRYVEQEIAGMAHAVERVSRRRLSFFQRIYDKRRVEANLVASLAAAGVAVRRTITIRRRSTWTAAAASALRRALPESVVTALGFLNPFLSRAINRHEEGLESDVSGSYGPVHSFGDIYGDAILIAEKPADGGGSR
jgi:SAM-dependent methyltransferase